MMEFDMIIRWSVIGVSVDWGDGLYTVGLGVTVGEILYAG